MGERLDTLAPISRMTSAPCLKPSSVSERIVAKSFSSLSIRSSSDNTSFFRADCCSDRTQPSDVFLMHIALFYLVLKTV